MKKNQVKPSVDWGLLSTVLVWGAMAGVSSVPHPFLQPHNRWQPLQHVPLSAGQLEVLPPGPPCFRVGRNCLAFGHRRSCLIGAAAFECGSPWYTLYPTFTSIPGSRLCCLGVGGVLARQNLNYVSFGKFMYFLGGHCEKIRKSG